MSSPTVTLTNDTASNLAGVNLKWVSANLAAIKEISLVYFKSASNSQMHSVDIPSGVVKYNLTSDRFDSGANYMFQLQVMDVNNVMVFSNTMSTAAPYYLSPPVITSVIGGDESMTVQLQSTSNILSSADTEIEFVIRREDDLLFWIIKPYASNGRYVLSRADSDILENDRQYSISCMYQPKSNNTRYSTPSAVSQTVLGSPSNSPNEPGSVSSSSGAPGASTLDVKTVWTRPSDFYEWNTSPFTIRVSVTSSLDEVTSVDLTTDVLEYTFTDLTAGKSYLASVQYINTFGDGPVKDSQSGYVLPKSIPSAPFLIDAADFNQGSLVRWSPTFDGQQAVTGYKIYKDGVNPVSVGLPDLDEYMYENLANGFSYDFEVTAVNAIGESARSNLRSATPFGPMTIISVVASGKTVTVTMNPNGRPIDRVLLIALDEDPNDAVDEQFYAEVPKVEIQQSQTSHVQVVKSFPAFSSNITFWCVIAQNQTGSYFLKSA